MRIALLLTGAVVALFGAAYEVALLAVGRAQLAVAVTRRLRGAPESPGPPAGTIRDLAAASATSAIGLVIMGASLPAFLLGLSGWEALIALLVLVVPVTLLGGHLLPRWLGHHRAERAAALLGPILRPWSAVLRVVLPAPPGLQGELRTLDREGAAVLPVPDVEMTLVGGALTFAQRPVREVMTPRTEIVALPEGAPLAQITQLLAESGYSRIPVYRTGLDEIVGMLYAFDYFALPLDQPLPIRPVAFAPASRSCGDLLLDMRRERRHLAVVLDEFGGTLGLVTLEDLLSALVGAIFDEGAGPDGAPPPPLTAGLLEADGALPVDEVEARLGVVFPSGRAATIGGRLAELAGRIPVAGERLVLRGIELDVLQASPARVERLVIRPQAPIPTELEGPSP